MIDDHRLSSVFNKTEFTFYRHFYKKSNQVEGRSEAQLKYVEEGEDEVSLGLWDRFLASCTKIPVQDNFYLNWWLRGLRGFDPEKDPTMAPPFLTKEGFTKLKVGQNLCEGMLLFLLLYRDLWTEFKCLHVLLKTT